jgi:hypothetical protein
MLVIIFHQSLMTPMNLKRFLFLSFYFRRSVSRPTVAKLKINLKIIFLTTQCRLMSSHNVQGFTASQCGVEDGQISGSERTTLRNNKIYKIKKVHPRKLCIRRINKIK